MSEVEAIYQQGVFKPLGAVNVAENQRVRLHIRPVQAAVIDRGRGPQIAGTRITVYDVHYEAQAGLSPDQIAELFALTPDQVQAAFDYISQNREQVAKNYARIMDRFARGMFLKF